MKNRFAFTMIELVFVIVVLGILAAVAVPKFAATRDDAIFVKGKSQISAIRSGIVMQKSKRLLEGNNSGGSYYPATLETTETSNLFDNGIMEYGLKDKQTDGNWHRTTDFNLTTIKYEFALSGGPAKFEYTNNNGQFICTDPEAICTQLTQ